jgi:hypothetical protein
MHLGSHIHSITIICSGLKQWCDGDDYEFS